VRQSARGLPDALARLVVDAGQRVARGALLEQPAQRVDLFEVVDVELGDEVAAARQVLDLALLFEASAAPRGRARR